MNIGEAVKERILELCRERDISINKLCSMSGVTQCTDKKLCDGLGITIEDIFHSPLFRDLAQEIQ